MEISSLQRKVLASDIAPEQLAGNTSLTQREKIAEASRQFEAVLLRQILENTQKTVIRSKYSDNSTASAIYREQVTTQLADSISKSGAFGFAKTFEQQLTRPADMDPKQKLQPEAHAANSTQEVKQQSSEHSARHDGIHRANSAYTPHLSSKKS